MEACRVIQFRGGPGNEHIRKACFDTAVMRYRRCFNTGKRGKYETDLSSKLTEEEYGLHEKVRSLADKSVAHCVDGSEENITYVTVAVTSENSFNANVSVHSGVVLHHEKVKAEKLEGLARKVRDIVRIEANVVAHQVLDQFKVLSPSQRSALPPLERLITDEGEEVFEKYGGAGTRLLSRK